MCRFASYVYTASMGCGPHKLCNLDTRHILADSLRLVPHPHYRMLPRNKQDNYQLISITLLPIDMGLLLWYNIGTKEGQQNWEGIMSEKYEVVWGSGDAGASGVYDRITGKQIASDWSLRRVGLPGARQVAVMTPQRIASVVSDHEYRWSQRRAS